MQIARLQEFIVELMHDSAVAELHGAVEVYWYFNNAWYFGDSSRVEDGHLQKRLLSTLMDPVELVTSLEEIINSKKSLGIGVTKDQIQAAVADLRQKM